LGDVYNPVNQVPLYHSEAINQVPLYLRSVNSALTSKASTKMKKYSFLMDYIKERRSDIEERNRLKKEGKMPDSKGYIHRTEKEEKILNEFHTAIGPEATLLINGHLNGTVWDPR
jgi:hypothetical protein